MLLPVLRVCSVCVCVCVCKLGAGCVGNRESLEEGERRGMCVFIWGMESFQRALVYRTAVPPIPVGGVGGKGTA